MSFSKTLYKKDSKGKLRYLEITTDGDELVQISGVIGTENPIEHRKVCTPKNVGKANETTGAEQAIAQAAALQTKKLRTGYFETQHDAETIEVIKPMLAKDYFKEIRKLKGKPLALQAKLDGIRCIVTWDAEKRSISAKTRENKDIDTIGHILDELKATLSSSPSCIIDGELYSHGLTFQENTKLVKNSYKDVAPLDRIDYCVYDIVDTSSKDNFRTRFLKLLNILSINELVYVTPCMTWWIDADKPDEIREQYKQCIDWGYEGLMVRVIDSKYKVNARSSDLLKYKEFIDTALVIVDITPNTANPSHGTAWVIYNGHKQKTGSKISHAERELMLTNKDDYIGKTAEIRYFEETDEGKMRFAYYHGLRIDK